MNEADLILITLYWAYFKIPRTRTTIQYTGERDYTLCIESFRYLRLKALLIAVIMDTESGASAE